MAMIINFFFRHTKKFLDLRCKFGVLLYTMQSSSNIISQADVNSYFFIWAVSIMALFHFVQKKGWLLSLVIDLLVCAVAAYCSSVALSFQHHPVSLPDENSSAAGLSYFSLGMLTTCSTLFTLVLGPFFAMPPLIATRCLFTR